MLTQRADHKRRRRTWNWALGGGISNFSRRHYVALLQSFCLLDNKTEKRMLMRVGLQEQPETPTIQRRPGISCPRLVQGYGCRVVGRLTETSN